METPSSKFHRKDQGCQGVGRVQVVAPLYHTRWINVRHVLVSIFVWVFVMRVVAYFVNIYGYP